MNGSGGPKENRFIKELLWGVADLFWPPACLLCSAPPLDPDSSFCTSCSSTIKTLRENHCDVCALPFEGVGDGHTCSRCSLATQPYKKVHACTEFTGGMRKLIHNFKYKGKLHVRAPLETIFLHGCNDWEDHPTFDHVVPVPCHPTTLASRGFDLAALLSRRLSKHWGVQWRPMALERTRRGERMAKLKLTERRKAVKGLYAAKEKVGGRVLLVDDVVTSSATVGACARILKRAGAGEVWVAALARTPIAPTNK